MKLFALVLTAVLALAYEVDAGLFDFSCPIGCASRTCTSLGCFQCSSGYFVYKADGQRITICLSSCPEGYYGHQLSFGGGWCTKCGIRNCKACSDRNTCTECNYRYELVGGRCQRKYRG